MITGYFVAPCVICDAKQKDLHLKTSPPCYVRCGKCGHKGPEQPTKGSAVFSWNVEHVDMGGSV